MERLTHKPVLSFEDWLSAKNVVIPAYDLAKLIVGPMHSHTRSSRGKLKADFKAYALDQKMRAMYDAEIKSGAIAVVEFRTPLDPEHNEADAAYIRARQHRLMNSARQNSIDRMRQSE